jgi:isopentenyl-diphosphate delta-isomerase
MSDKRKTDHIELAFSSKTTENNKDIYYEPILNAHPTTQLDLTQEFMGIEFKAPLWISSMTGGTQRANLINKNLAIVAGEFGFGMGLGSCRPLLESNDRFSDFNQREHLGDNAFFINLGVAQLEQMIEENKLPQVEKLISSLKADGLIIHVNPMQEWFQPEGDRFKQSPLKTIEIVSNFLSTKLIVKEVGQGFGPKSLECLMKLPLAAIELSGFGGTNFSLLELSRHNAQKLDKEGSNNSLIHMGHSCDEMINWINPLVNSGDDIKCKSFIISGGVSNIVDGYQLQNKLGAQSIIGMASSFLKHAEDIGQLREFVTMEIENLKFCHNFIKGK